MTLLKVELSSAYGLLLVRSAINFLSEDTNPDYTQYSLERLFFNVVFRYVIDDGALSACVSSGDLRKYADLDLDSSQHYMLKRNSTSISVFKVVEDADTVQFSEVHVMHLGDYFYPGLQHLLYLMAYDDVTLLFNTQQSKVHQLKHLLEFLLSNFPLSTLE